jgi:hypothetical protein
MILTLRRFSILIAKLAKLRPNMEVNVKLPKTAALHSSTTQDSTESKLRSRKKASTSQTASAKQSISASKKPTRKRSATQHK